MRREGAEVVKEERDGVRALWGIRRALRGVVMARRGSTLAERCVYAVAVACCMVIKMEESAKVKA